MKLKYLIPEVIDDFNKLTGDPTTVTQIEQSLLPSIVGCPEEIHLNGLTIVVMGGVDENTNVTYFIVKSEDETVIIKAKFSFSSTLRHYFCIKLIEKSRGEYKIPVSSIYGEMENTNKKTIKNPDVDPYSVEALIRENCPGIDDYKPDIYEQMVQKNPIQRLEEAIRQDEYRDRYSLDGIMENSGSVAEALNSIRNKVDGRGY